jgi:hypothetical protein
MNQDAFLIVNGQPSRPLELAKEELQAVSSSHVRLQDDKGVIGVLQDRAGSSVNESVQKDLIVADQLLEHVGDQEEEIGRERVSLPQASNAANPSSRHTIQEHRRA